MLKHRSILFGAGLLLSGFLALVGIQSLRRGSLATGLPMTVAAVIIFALVAIFNEKYPLGEDEDVAYKQFFQKWGKPYLGPGLFWLTSIVVLILVVDAMSDLQRSAQINRWVTAGWITSILCAIIGMLWAVHWHFPSWKQFKEWFKNNRRELLVLAAVVVVAVFFRLFMLELHPFPWSGDEASVGIEGRRILQGEVTDFFDAGWSGQPNWSFVPTALSIVIFGQTFFAIRIVSAVEGILAVIALYLLARELFDSKIALLAAGFLAAYPHHLQISRLGVNNINDSLNVCLVLWLTVRAVRKGKISGYLWAGMAAGLSFYTYVGSRLVLALAFVVLAYAAIRTRRYLRTHLGHLGVFLIGLAILITPMVYYFIRHPEVFMTRLGSESIFFSHWLTNQARNTGQSVFSILWKQFTDTALVFISQQAIGNFFNYPKPYLTVLGSIFFLFGMGYAFVRFLETKMMVVLVWFWSVVFLGGVFTLSPPANPRLIMTAPVVAIFLALGIVKLTEILGRLRIMNQGWQVGISAALIVILAVQNVSLYFGDYRTKNGFDDATGELTQKIGLELQALGPNYDYYLYGLPRVFAAFPTVVFLAPESGMYDLKNESVETLTLKQGRGAIIVAIPENLEVLQRITQLFPGGTWEEVPRSYRNEALYYAYILPATSIP